MAVIGAAPEEPLPMGFDRLPGPSLFIAARYSDSPVGPYVELAAARPVRLGARPGLCVTTMAVDSSDSVVGGRSNWGFPKELSALRWIEAEHGSSLAADDLGVETVARPRGPDLPLVTPLLCLQRRDDGPVQVLGWLRGRCRSAGVDVDAEGSDRLSFAHGLHQGVVVTGLRLVVSAGRRVGHA